MLKYDGNSLLVSSCMIMTMKTYSPSSRVCCCVVKMVNFVVWVLQLRVIIFLASSPNVADISTEEKKRKRECMDSNESNSEDDEYDDATDDPSYGFLNRTLNSHSEAADADYEVNNVNETLKSFGLKALYEVV